MTELTEREFSTQVYDLARATGWLRYHTYRSKRSPAGFPDETLVRERVVFLELKTEEGKPTDEQRRWLVALLDAGAEAYLARPRHLDALSLLLAHRGDPYQSRGPVVETAARLRADTCKAVGRR